MTVTIVSGPAVVSGRPSFEGANIRTWIGFKHFMYLVEDAVHQWLREQGTTARDLYLERGLGFGIVDCSVQLPAVLEIDDEVTTTVTALRGERLAVRMSVVRNGGTVTVLRGKVTVALVKERSAACHRSAPPSLGVLEATAPVAEERRQLIPGQTAESVLTAQPGVFLWSWRVPYFYCQYSDRVQHSGFVRALEEVVDRFLADRGLSVGTLLTERSWIPVVSRARVSLVGDARMEETVHTVFQVTSVLRGVMFDATMSCYVQRGSELVTVARAQILHGYAIAAGPGAGGLAELDAGIVAVLLGRQP